MRKFIFAMVLALCLPSGWAMAQDNLTGLSTAPAELPSGFIVVGMAQGKGGYSSTAASALFPVGGNPGGIEGVWGFGVRFDPATETGTDKGQDVELGLSLNRRFVVTAACELGDVRNCFGDKRPFVKFMANFRLDELMSPITGTFNILRGVGP